MSRCFTSNAWHARVNAGDNSPEYWAALERPCTCLLPSGHAGAHEWTFDGDVVFSFIPNHADRKVEGFSR
jgi:hypothetical protein